MVSLTIVTLEQTAFALTELRMPTETASLITGTGELIGSAMVRMTERGTNTVELIALLAWKTETPPVCRRVKPQGCSEKDRGFLVTTATTAS
jgi:hypothetical protein